jgi:galactonate dehydratase
MPNFQILEFSFGEVGWRANVLEPAEQVVNGFIGLSERPGFGIAINEKTVSEHAV